MLKVFLRRLLLLAPTLLGVSLLAFAFIRWVPGDTVQNMTGQFGLNPEQHAARAQELGLNQALPVQYLHYLGRLLQGDLGVSTVSGVPVLEEFMELFPATLELTGCALLLAVLLGIPAGMYAAVATRSASDRLITGTALVGYSLPVFWWGLLLVMWFSLNLHLTPVAGRLSFLFDIEPKTGFMLIDTLLSEEPYAEEAFFNALHHLLLPTVVLATIPTALFTLITRSAMLEVLSSDYIRAARAYGLSRWTIVTRHAFRNALVSVISVLALQVSVFFTGAMLTETIFAWPGVGKWLLESVGRRDYVAVQGALVLIALFAVLLNTLFDLLEAWVNPRTRQ